MDLDFKRFGARQWVAVGVGVAAVVVLSVLAAGALTRTLVQVLGTSTGKGGAVEEQPQTAPVNPPPSSELAVPVEGGSAENTGIKAGAPGTAADVTVNGLSVAGRGASPESTAAAADTATAAVPGFANDIHVGEVDVIEVSASLANVGGSPSLPRQVRITLYTPANPAGRSVTQAVPRMDPGTSLSVTATFDGLSSIVHRRVSVWVALLPGDGGQVDQRRQGVVLAR